MSSRKKEEERSSRKRKGKQGTEELQNKSIKNKRQKTIKGATKTILNSF
jgi:hypothetical protein